MVWFGKNSIKFIGALLNIVKLSSTKTCSSARVRARYAGSQSWARQFNKEFFSKFHDITIFFRHACQYDLSHVRRSKIHDILHDFMKNYEFWCTKECPAEEFISEFIYEFMENHEFIYDFMKKTIWGEADFGCGWCRLWLWRCCGSQSPSQ